MKENGYLPYKTIKAFTFWMLSACILVGTTSGILRSWEVIDDTAATRCFWTIASLALGSTLFHMLNLLFGGFARELFFTPVTTHPLDPAFAERLKKAKTESHAETAPKERTETSA